MNEKDLANRFRTESLRYRKEVRQLLADIDQKVDYVIGLHRELRGEHRVYYERTGDSK